MDKGLQERDLSLQLVEAIDQSIQARYIYGKFIGPVVFHGKEVLPAGYNQKKDREMVLVSGDGELIEWSGWNLKDPTHQHEALRHLINDALFPSNSPKVGNFLKELAQYHTFAYYRNPLDPLLSHLCLIYPYEFYDSDLRPNFTMSVFFTLPTAQLQELLSLIQKSPDVVEQFYQKASTGLDNSVKRYRSPKVALIDLEQFMAIDAFKEVIDTHPDTAFYQLVKYNKAYLRPEKISFLDYRQPYGSIDRPNV